jgi:NADH dehydrogenase FAD-containing subunit
VQKSTRGLLHLNNEKLGTDLTIWTAGSRLPDFYSQHADIFGTDRGQIIVDEYLHAQGLPTLFIAGDNAATPYGGMAQTALQHAESIAANILRARAGTKLQSFIPQQPVYIVPVGRKWAACQSGDKVITGYRGWIARRRADLQIFMHFEPYRQAIQTWRHAHKLVKF